MVGKGGAGKSVIAGTMARLLARRGQRVLALDSDPMPGLSFSLGNGANPPESPLRHAAERGGGAGWRLKRGIGPVRAVQRHATDAPDGVRLLEIGETADSPPESYMPALYAFHQVVHRLPGARAFRDWAIIGDLPAGPRQAAYDWAPYADAFVVVVQPAAQSALTARRVARILRMRAGAQVVFVASQVDGRRDVEHVEQLIGERVLESVPADAAVAEAERLGLAPIDHAPGSPTVVAIERLVRALTQAHPPG
jgi:CO dehydrogenase maturation factor